MRTPTFHTPTPRLVDLSWPVNPDMPMYPGDPPMGLTRMGSIETHGYLSHLASLPAHSGTHVDAPAHVIAGGAPLSALPLSRFMGPGVVLDLRGESRRHEPGQAVTAQDLTPLLGQARDAAFVLLMTGTEALWHRPEEYYARGAYLTVEAAELLAALPGPSGRGLSGIGIDSGSADALDTTTLPASLPAHQALLGAGLLIVENLRGLDQLPPSGFLFQCLPILGQDGSPVRATALIFDQEGPA